MREDPGEKGNPRDGLLNAWKTDVPTKKATDPRGPPSKTRGVKGGGERKRGVGQKA